MSKKPTQADFDKIVIYPAKYSKKKRNDLYKFLKNHDVHFEYEQYH
ncbi:MAG: hypothetical protein KGY50_02695 [Candidatus Thermoplasmatota archaeon]|nr:hypothetical protein [Candidatus Thermoplasmatota archaeon]